MNEEPGKSGIKAIEDVVWGMHFCQFYRTQEDLMDILVPYFKAGLENNELCIWAISNPFKTKEETIEVFRKLIPQLDTYLEEGQIEIIHLADLYIKDGVFNSQKALNYWIEKVNQASNNGYNGLRLTEDLSWLKKDWNNLIDYEEKLGVVTENHRMTALCTYSLNQCDATETVDAAMNHRFALVKREGKWKKAESPGLKRAEKAAAQAEKNVKMTLTEAEGNSDKYDNLEKHDSLEKLVDGLSAELEKAYEALKESENCLTQAQRMAHIGNWKWNVATGELYWSEEIYRIFGCNPENFGKTYDAFLSYVHPNDREYVINSIKNGFNGKIHNIDYRIIRPDREERVVHTQAEISFDENNLPVRAEGIVQDITERKKAEEALRKSEERYRMLFTNMSEAFFLGEIICNKYGKPYDYRFLEVNPAFEFHAGVKEEQVLGKSHLEIFLKADPAVIEKYGGVALSGNPTHFEFFTQLTNRYLDVYVFSLEKGKFAATFIDVTERKRLEEQTRQRAEEMETVMDVTPVAIWIGHDPQCNNITGNRMANEFYEAEVGENVSANATPVRRFFHKSRELIADELPMQKAALKDIDVRSEDIDVLLPSGEWKGLLGSASPLHDAKGNVRGSVGAFIDITERKKTEAKLKETLDNLEVLIKARTAELEMAYSSLKESEVSLAEAQKIAHIGNWEWDLVTGKIHGSDEMYRIFGLAPQESKATYDSLLNYVHPDDLEYMNSVSKDILKRESHAGIDFKIVSADGQERVVHGRGKIIFNEENIPVRIKGTVQDITERKKTEKALELSEEKYRIIAEQTGQLVYDYKVNEDAADWTGNIKETTGYSPEEYKNMSMDFLLSHIHPEDRKMFLENYERFLTYGGTYRSEYRFRKENGEYIYLEDHGVCLKDEKGKVKRILGATKDITERKNAEKALANLESARKREIHHRIKNNLQVISSLLDLQAEKFKNRKNAENSDVLDAFRESQDRVLSIALIHEELHEGRGTDKLNFCPYLEKLVENLLKTYRVGNTDINLDMSLEEDIFFDMDIAVPLGLIVNEIVSNSLKYAFSGKEKGIVRIRLCREENEESASKIPEIRKDYKSKNEKDYKKETEEGCKIENANFVLTISDNGIGLPDEFKPDNFNLDSSDTLGLQLIFILVDQLEGNIELKNGSGTEFSIRFEVPEKV